MRGTRAKDLRREQPSRPNPGRVCGGAVNKVQLAQTRKERTEAYKLRKEEWAKFMARFNKRPLNMPEEEYEAEHA